MNLDAFYNKYVNQSVLYNTSDASLRGQCVQLVAFYVQECWGKPVIWDDAYGWYIDGRLPEHYVRVANNHSDPSQVPPRGAVIVWGPNTPGSAGLGHIAICWNANPGAATFTSFDTNWGGKTAHLVTHNWSNVVGWLLPRSAAPAAAPVQPTTQGDEMITTQDDAAKLYRMLRPNGGVSQGELDATVNKRSFHQFVNDAQNEILMRDNNFTKQNEVLGSMQQSINSLNQTITDLRTKGELDATEVRAAHEKISYLTSQLESGHDKITDLQNANVPAQAEAKKDEPSAWAKLILALLPKKK